MLFLIILTWLNDSDKFCKWQSKSSASNFGYHSWMFLCVVLVITAHIHSIMGRYCFHRCVSVHTWGVPPGQDWGTPVARDGVPLARDGIPLVRTRVSPSQDWGTSLVTWDRIADRVLYTRRVGCLLHSRKKTFLFLTAIMIMAISSSAAFSVRENLNHNFCSLVWVFTTSNSDSQLLTIKFYR